MNATQVSKNRPIVQSSYDNVCGINMNTELVAHKANLAMSGFDFTPDANYPFNDIKDWYTREYLIICNAMRQASGLMDFESLLQDVVEYNRSLGRPDVADELIRIFSKEEQRVACRVLPFRRKANRDSNQQQNDSRFLGRKSILSI